ncbi:peptidoglycan -binding protein [Camelimonas abortus]|uniref:Peptidoglycan -binding protein n=1 Tax=Camelimonas abortus TaxID=1017184 RepID=A0ABV7LDU7_9HYPH
MGLLARGRRERRSPDYWPGFVDALSTLVLAVVFMLSLFAVLQYYLGQELLGKDSALTRLNRQISGLSELLALERARSRSQSLELDQLRSSLAAMETEKRRLQQQADSHAAAAGRLGTVSDELDAQKRISDRALSQVELLNQQVAALRRQLAALEEALAASEARDREAQARIADLGGRLNVALAQKVQELARYRSDFFGRLRQILGDRDDIRVVGDRFIFQSEVLFDTGSATLSERGRAELDKIASAIRELSRVIPADIPWVLRVDGHTDDRPLSGAGQFRNNWELSAARAIAVVQYLISRGAPPQRLLAAGFAEYQPLEPGDSDAARARNRRIELKLTER